MDGQGRARYAPDLDEQGRQKRGAVTHSYSISSAPCETKEQGWLEFYVVLEKGDAEYPGRLTESLAGSEQGHRHCPTRVIGGGGDRVAEPWESVVAKSLAGIGTEAERRAAPS